MVELLDKLEQNGTLSPDEFYRLITGISDQDAQDLRRRARKKRDEVFGRQVFLRGLIECSSYCKNDCNYCGLRKGNPLAQRYRLTGQEILGCCEEGYRLGFRSFVLQGGEDPWFDDRRLEEIVRAIRREYPDCAIILSLGERSYESYKRLRQAGADRYLLRHETADEEHYRVLHPQPMELASRKQCLWNLRELGFQVGCGFMVGSPGQRPEHLVSDLLFIKEFNPHMVGIGPFIPHKDTPFCQQPAGGLGTTLLLLSVVRLMLPRVLLPATTALATLAKGGREEGLEAGANVLMPNLSPGPVRKKYLLYNNKHSDGKEAAESADSLRKSLGQLGYEAPFSRGDHPDAPQHNV